MNPFTRLPWRCPGARWISRCTAATMLKSAAWPPRRVGVVARMSEQVPTVCVIVVAYDSGAHLGGCIAALARQSWRDFEAIVFDNASRDGAVDA